MDSSWLEKHPKIAWVSYLGLPNHPYHERAKKLIRPNAYGGVLSFGVKGDLAAASKVVDTLRLASNLANVGDAKTVIIHPASTTHEQLTEEERLETGVTPDLIRVRVSLTYGQGRPNAYFHRLIVDRDDTGCGWHRTHQRYHCRL